MFKVGDKVTHNQWKDGEYEVVSIRPHGYYGIECDEHGRFHVYGRNITKVKDSQASAIDKMAEAVFNDGIPQMSNEQLMSVLELCCDKPDIITATTALSSRITPENSYQYCRNCKKEV